MLAGLKTLFGGATILIARKLPSLAGVPGAERILPSIRETETVEIVGALVGPTCCGSESE